MNEKFKKVMRYVYVYKSEYKSLGRPVVTRVFESLDIAKDYLMREFIKVVNNEKARSEEDGWDFEEGLGFSFDDMSVYIGTPVGECYTTSIEKVEFTEGDY